MPNGPVDPVPVAHVCGVCETFCPQQEIKLRTKEKLLHFYELKNGQRDVPGILVKEFSRSAAGMRQAKSKDLRTEQCLQRTVDYLLGDIILDKRRPYNFVYDFIFDRLRAIRQEIVIQSLDVRATIKLLEPIIMFLAYSLYRLCEEPIDGFDPKICEQHLQECLKRVLCCYDANDNGALTLTPNEIERRVLIEALYQIFNLGSIEALNRCTTLPATLRAHPLYKTAFTMAMSEHQGNFYRILHHMRDLPHILCAVACLKIQTIRRKLFENFSHAYNNKQLKVSAEFLCRLLNYENVDSLLEDCEYYNVSITADRQQVQFIKSDFKTDAPALKPKREKMAEQKLETIYLPDVLLLKNF